MLQDIRLVSLDILMHVALTFYQVLQRVYKYGGQPFVRDILSKNYGTEFDRTFGPKTGKAMMHSLAGRSVNSLARHTVATADIKVAV